MDQHEGTDQHESVDQHESTDQRQCAADRDRRVRRIGVWVDAGILLAFVPIGWYLGMLAMMGALDCPETGPDTGICARGMQAFVVLVIPSTTLFGAILVGALGTIWIKKHRSPNLWHVLAWALVLCSWFVSFGIGWFGWGASGQMP